MTQRAVVIGGGICGLTAAFELAQLGVQSAGGIEVICLEASPRPGGAIGTAREAGYTCEWGPNGFLSDAPETLELVRRLGLEPRLLASDPATAKRFLFRAGRLRALPDRPRKFLGSDVLSWRGKLRALSEPLRPRRRDSEGEESVFAFAARRVGDEAASILADAMVSGIYAGDARRLSIRAAFPSLWNMEREHGSLLRALRKRRAASARNRAAQAGPGGSNARLMSFPNGLQELPDRLALALGPSLRLSTPVERVSALGRAGFRVQPQEGPPLDAAVVILACPAASAAALIEAMDPLLAAASAGIPAAPIAVVHVGFEAARIGGKPDGFGYLVPRGEGLRTLGALWSSSIFPSRAPAGKALLTSMLGGATDPAAVGLPDSTLVALVLDELRTAMGIAVAPEFVSIVRHGGGIPQYTLGHGDRLATIDERLAAHPGLWVTGNSFRGVSVNACVTDALRSARAAASFLQARSAEARG